MNIYVGNLAYDVTNDDLQAVFQEFGEVASAKVIRDRESGESRGFGFVEMPNDDEGKAAIEQLNDSEVKGRRLKVAEAKPREDRSAGPRRF